MQVPKQGLEMVVGWKTEGGGMWRAKGQTWILGAVA